MTSHSRGEIAASVRRSVRTLHASSFALVMATGIVSIGMNSEHQPVLSRALLAIAGIAWIVLSILYAWRIAAHRDAFRDDLSNPRTGFGFFTFVAATNVLGTRFAVGGEHRLALGLLVVGTVSWVVLGYLVPLATVHRSTRPALAAVNGTWFLWVVAAQSVAVLAAILEPTLGTGRGALALLAVFGWAVGTFLYSVILVLVTARLMLYPLRPADLGPPYWIAMGASAITVVAGAGIVEMADAPMVAVTRGLVAGTSVLFWCFATWLIPMLVIAGWWRHVTHRHPLRYEPALWSVIFPLGMYGVASDSLGAADKLPFVAAVGSVEAWIALAAWTILFAAMLRHLSRTTRARATRALGRTP